jgi:hypothetical protein
VLLRQEFSFLTSWGARHQRLVARLLLVLTATFVVDIVGTLFIYFFERHAPGTDIKNMWDAAFFTTVQLLTVSSQIKNPFTVGGRITDIVLEVWAVIVVAGSAGAIASFFSDAA